MRMDEKESTSEVHRLQRNEALPGRKNPCLCLQQKQTNPSLISRLRQIRPVLAQHPPLGTQALPIPTALR